MILAKPSDGISVSPSCGPCGSDFLNVAETVTSPAGIVKLLFATSTGFPAPSVTVRVSNTNPSAGLAVIVTVLPFFAEVGFTVICPFSAGFTFTL